MRGYGLPRNDDVANPDLADIRHFGLSNQDHPLCRKSKATSRRLWKRIERSDAKEQIRKELNTEE